MFCTQCGKKITDGYRFCTNCGAPVSDNHKPDAGSVRPAQTGGQTAKGSAPVRYVQPVPARKNKAKFIAVIVIVCILVLGASGTAFWFLGGGDWVMDLFDGSDDSGSASKEKKDEKEEKRSKEDDAEKDDTEEDDTEIPISKEEDDESERKSDSTKQDADVEKEVSALRRQYQNIASGISGNVYVKVNLSDGVEAYYSEADHQLKAVIIFQGIDNNAYDKYYYYDDNELFFAYYRGEELHDFYFEDGSMIRWSYAADAAKAQDAVDYDDENTSNYNSWEKKVKKEAESLYDAWETGMMNGSFQPQYKLEGSDYRYISRSELDGFTAEDCRIARNEIYARHGRKFDDEALQNYFLSFDWYIPTIEPGQFQESMLNEYEIANRDLILQYEKEMGYR